MKPIKVIHDSRAGYLKNLAGIYEDMGYTVKVEQHVERLDVYAKGVKLPKSKEELMFDKYIN